MTKEQRFRVVLFDLGGILLRLRDPAETFGLTTTVDEFNRRWLQSGAVREFERGRIEAAEFAERGVRELGLDCDATEFLRRFDRWPHSLYPGAVRLLQSIPGHYQRAVLSNTNALHWSRSGIRDRVEPEIGKAFLSFETGAIKPDEAAFLQVTDFYRCQPGEVLFLDDNPLNTEAARRYGLHAMLAVGIDNVRNALIDAGVISREPSTA